VSARAAPFAVAIVRSPPLLSDRGAILRLMEISLTVAELEAIHQVVQEHPPVNEHPPQTGAIEIGIAPSKIRTVQVRWKVPGVGGRALQCEATIHAGAVVSISGPGIK
jgi:hypothetical protein